MAYLGVDIGGTKTLLAVFDDNGTFNEDTKFPTPQSYPEFIDKLKDSINNLKVSDFTATAVALPGVIDRKRGVGIGFGNLPWKNVQAKADIEQITHSPVVIENDANLAGLSEAILLKNEYRKVLYITVSTGIGGGIIIDGIIDPDFINTQPGDMMLEHNGVIQKWEDFASGRAIVEQFGKKARDITDPVTWRKIAANLSLGLLNLFAIVRPEVVVIGGGVGNYFDRFEDPLNNELKRYYNPLVPTPPIRAAKRPDLAVVYGCFDLAKATYGSIHK